MSPSPDAREALREAEARVARVRAENDELQRQLLRSIPSPPRLVGYLAAAALGVALGFVVASRAGARNASLLLRASSGTAAERTSSLRDSLQRCETENVRTRALVVDCRTELARPTAPEEPSKARPACTCEPGDPLCSCE